MTIGTLVRVGQSGSEYIDVQIHPGQNECADFYVSLYLNN